MTYTNGHRSMPLKHSTNATQTKLHSVAFAKTRRINMAKSIDLVRQNNGLWKVTTVETTVDIDVVCTITDKIVPPPVVIPPTVLFHDDFSSMDLKKVSNGIYWSSSNKGSGDLRPVVSKDMMFNDKPSLKFTFGGGPPDDDAWCEQRFKIDTKLSDVWIQYYRYYPSGTELVNVGPKWVHRDAPGSDNNKVFLLWSGPYQGYPITTGISAWQDGEGRDIFYPTYGTNQLNGAGQRGLPSVPAQKDSTLGRWVKTNMHFKCATLANNDGVIQLWEDDVLIMDNTKIPLYPKDGIGNFFTEGYLMGWSNTGFDQTTHCYIADFKIDDKPIIS